MEPARVASPPPANGTTQSPTKPELDIKKDPAELTTERTVVQPVVPHEQVDDIDEAEDNGSSDGEDDMGSQTSFYEEILGQDQDESVYASEPNPDVCTAEEAKEYRERVRRVAPAQFVYETVSAGNVTAKKLCTAFGIKIPFFEGASDTEYYPLLGQLLSRELSRRQRLLEYQTIDDAAKLIQRCKNVLVITGAGISTSLGIPDFRSKNTGFYSKLISAGIREPEEVFTLSNFDDDPSTFYTLAGDILPDLDRWTPAHDFIRLLQDKGKLLRNYTQNIDNIESHAGIRSEKIVQCHGSWATATCRKEECRYQIPGHDIFEDVKAQQVSQCKQCIERIRKATPRPGMKRKRSSRANVNSAGKWMGKLDNFDDDEDDEQYDIPQPGVMKPDITFFGEKLPDKFFDLIRNEDRDKVDLIIVMGTSMKVAPVSEIPQFIPPGVPQIYISKDTIHHIDFDINLIGDCDTVVAELCRRAGWKMDHPMVPKDSVVDIRSRGGKDNVFDVRSADHKEEGSKDENSLSSDTVLPSPDKRPKVDSLANRTKEHSPPNGHQSSTIIPKTSDKDTPRADTGS